MEVSARGQKVGLLYPVIKSHGHYCTVSPTTSSMFLFHAKDNDNYPNIAPGHPGIWKIRPTCGRLELDEPEPSRLSGDLVAHEDDVVQSAPLPEVPLEHLFRCLPCQAAQEDFPFNVRLWRFDHEPSTTRHDRIRRQRKRTDVTPGELHGGI